MNLEQFLHTQTYHPNLVDIILNIKNGSILMYKKLNETSSDIFGLSGRKNIQNEEVQKLDLIANDIFITKFQTNSAIAKILSEENEEIINLNQYGNYLVAMDPLDGSSNIDVNIPVGSIFSVLENNSLGFMQAGKNQKLACYVIYGTTTMMIFSINNKAHGFSLNTKTKEYILTHENIKTPSNGVIFSINEGNLNSLDSEIIEFTNYCKELNSDGKRTHTGRFVGSLIADFHRNMLKGGIFIYPKTSDKPEGQLRLIYECNPIAYIAQATSSKSSNLKTSILEIIPRHIHERTPFVVGSSNMVEKLLSFYKK